MKVLFVGVGSIGTRHLNNITAVCRERGIQLECHALRHGTRALPEATAALLSRQFTDAAATDTDYDAVFVTNPTNLHYDAIEALKDHTGCFFIEKPIFETSRRSLETAGLVGKKAYIAAPMRWCGTFMKLRELVKSREVYSARIICSSYLPEWRKGVDYRTVYSARRELGGGVTIDLIHEWDYMVELFGFPEECFTLLGKYSNLEINSDDLSVAIARYPRMLAELHLDYIGRGYRRSIEMLCADGNLFADFGAGTITLEDGTVIDCAEPVNDRFMREMGYFVDYCLNGQGESVNSPEKALAVLKLALKE